MSNLINSLILIFSVILIIYGLTISIKENFRKELLNSVLISITLYLSIYHVIALICKLLEIENFPFFISLANLILLFFGFYKFIKNYIKRRIFFSLLINNYDILLPLLAVFIFYGFVGGIFIPGSIDELAYHIPQAVGAYQKNTGIYGFDGPLPWIKHYPQGVSIIWGYLVFVYENDYFLRFPQLLFLAQLLLAAAILLRHRGVSRSILNYVLIAICVTPIVYLMVTTNKADLAYCSMMLAFVAILYPCDKRSVSNLLFSLVAFSSAISIKIPIIASIFYFICVILYLFPIGSKQKYNKFEFGNYLYLPLILYALVCFLSSLYIYISNYIGFGNPFYPINVSIAGHNIFNGPLIINVISGHTTFGDIQNFSKLRLWHAIFYDIFSPINEDSYGSSGFIFGAFFLTQFILSVCLIKFTKDNNNIWKIFISLSILLLILIPSLYVPRYHLIFLILIVIIGVDLINELPVYTLNRINYGLYILLIPSFFIIIQNFYEKYSWVSSNSVSYDRGVSLQYRYPVYPEMSPSPETVKFVKENISADDFIYVGTKSIIGLFWNNSYTNMVIFNSKLVNSNCSDSSYFHEIPSNSYLLVNEASCLSQELSKNGFTLVFKGTSFNSGNNDVLFRKNKK